MTWVLALLPRQDPVDVEGQPLAAQVERVLQALDQIGRGADPELRAAIHDAGQDPRKIQQALQGRVFLEVTAGTPGKAARGRAPAVLQQNGFTPFLVRVVNESALTRDLKISSPQAGPVYAGVAELSMQRQDQKPLRENENAKGESRFLQLERYASPPLTPALSGLKVEYVVLLIYSSEAGPRPADLEVEGVSVPVEFEVRPAVPLRLSIRDADGTPTTARLTFTDAAGHVHPPQPKRLAPDLFFQKQVYRHDGETVLLPPGRFRVAYNRGPEYLTLEREFEVPAKGGATLELELRRWVHPADRGFYGGDHHIHAAGCAHYTKPSEGVLAPDMFRQVKGEGLNVGCLLTWGPCFDYQRQFFLPTVDKMSDPLTLIKYDIEVSGFGSQALGHVCLLNLKDQVYPGSEGSKKWPTWTTPVLKWAKAQGAVTGYAHSASGLQIDPAKAARRLMAELDRDGDGRLTPEEAGRGLLPAGFPELDRDRNLALDEGELRYGLDQAADWLPNVAVPEMNSVGAMEIFVTVPQGLCDFISAMDTARVAEWNCWYHLMNCGFPLKASGETDFPCMSGTRVGQGRVYVRLGKEAKLEYTGWCDGVARGRSYVSDGFAHALEFTVAGKRPGEEAALEKPGTVAVRATVAFGSQTPIETPYGGILPAEGRRLVGDTVNLHSGAEQPRRLRTVEIVVNGARAASREVPADDREHELAFEVPLDRSSWVALREFPQLHTNPVAVVVEGKPIRASRRSALWCIGCIEQLWRMREKNIAPAERDAAKKAFDEAIQRYRTIAAECPEGS